MSMNSMKLWYQFMNIFYLLFENYLYNKLLMKMKIIYEFENFQIFLPSLFIFILFILLLYIKFYIIFFIFIIMYKGL